MSKRFGRASLRAIHTVVENLERRALMSVDAQFIPFSGGIPGSPIPFSWETPVQGRDVIDSAPTQRSLLRRALTDDANATFLKIDGIEGESTDAKHKNEIDVIAWEFGGDRDTEPFGDGPDFGEFRVVANASKASPAIMAKLTQGDSIPNAQLQVRNPLGTTALDIDLTDVVISSYHVTSANSGLLRDEVTLSFATAAVTYTPVINMVPQAPVFYSWNVEQFGQSVSGVSLAERSFLNSSAPQFASSLDGFLRLDGVQGASTDAKHKNQIDIEGFEWIFDGPAAPPTAADPVSISEVRLIAPVNVQTPVLLTRLTAGTVIPSADFNIRRSGGTQLEFYRLHLEDLTVSSHRISTSLTGSPVEEFTLSFGQIDLDFVPQNTDGTAGTPVNFTFDATAPNVDLRDTQPAQRPILFTPPLAGPIDMFLELDGVVGDSTDKVHKGAVEILEFEWGADRAIGGPPNQASFSQLHVTSLVSRASPVIITRLNQATIIPNGLLAIRKSGGDQFEFFDAELTGVRVINYQTSTAPDGRLIEEFTLSFNSVDLSFIPQLAGGQAGSPVTFAHNLVTNSSTVRPFDASQRGVLDAPVVNLIDDGFLHLDGVEGNSTDKSHVGDIEILSYEWGMSRQPDSNADYHEIHVTAVTSIASPVLMDRLADGTIIPDADLVIRRSGGTQQDLLRFDLNNAVISSYAVTARGGQVRLVEEFTIRFDSYTLQYLPLNTDGTLGSPVTAAFTVSSLVTERFDVQQDSLIGEGQGLGFDGFLRLDGITGDSTDGKHLGEILVRNLDWGVDTAGGGVKYNELHITGNLSRANPQLLARLASGTTIVDGDLVLRQTGAALHEFYKVDLDNAVISSVRSSSSETGTPIDEITITFTGTTVQFIPLLETGQSGPAVTFTHNLTATGATVEDYTPERRMLTDANLLGTTSATDFFLQLDGVQGESTAKGHTNEIDVLVFEWDADRDTTAPNAGGPDFGEVRIVARTSRASTTLLDRLSTGRNILTGQVTVRRASNDEDYYLLDLDNAVISSYRVGANTSLGVIEELTISFDRPVDATPPQLLTRVFEFETAELVHLGFSENVGPSLNSSDFVLTNLTTGQVVPAAQYAVSFDFTTNTATIDPINLLVDGNYRLEFINTGIRDGNNNALAATTPFEFFVFRGDANRNRLINLDDFATLASRFNTPGTYSQGDFNYNGQTEIGDFAILASKFNTSLPAPRFANAIFSNQGSTQLNVFSKTRLDELVESIV